MPTTATPEAPQPSACELKPVNTVPEFSNYLGVCLATGNKIVANREVLSFKVGRCRRISREAILEYVRKLQAGE